MSIAPLAEFPGQVDCKFDGCGPLGLILSGHTVQRPRELAHLAFAGAAPANFPRQLQSATVTRVGESSYRIVSGTQRWTLTARAAHLHREAATAFFDAVPSRPVRWTRRLFWAAVLILGKTSAGRALLRAVRGG